MNIAAKLAEPLTVFLADIADATWGLCRQFAIKSKPLPRAKQGWLRQTLEWWGTRDSLYDRLLD